MDVGHSFTVQGAEVAAGNATVNAQNFNVSSIEDPNSPATVLSSTVNVAGTMDVNLENDFVVQGATVEAGTLNVNAQSFRVAEGTGMQAVELDAMVETSETNEMMETASENWPQASKALVSVTNSLNVDVIDTFSVYSATVVADAITVNAANVLVESGMSADMMTSIPGVLLGGTNIDISANAVEIQAGYGPDGFATITSLGDLSIDAGTLEIYGGEGSSAGATPIDTSFFENFTGEATNLPPFATAFGFNSVNLDVENLIFEGGSADQAFAAIVSNGLFNVAAENASLTSGTGENADAVFLALGGVAEIAIPTCENCDQIFFDPLSQAESNSGVFIAGLLQEPSTDAIVNLLDKEDAADNTEGEDAEDEEEEDGPGECN